VIEGMSSFFEFPPGAVWDAAGPAFSMLPQANHLFGWQRWASASAREKTDAVFLKVIMRPVRARTNPQAADRPGCWPGRSCIFCCTATLTSCGVISRAG
jgi:hypothetical protein